MHRVSLSDCVLCIFCDNFEQCFVDLACRQCHSTHHLVSGGWGSIFSIVFGRSLLLVTTVDPHIQHFVQSEDIAIHGLGLWTILIRFLVNGSKILPGSRIYIGSKILTLASDHAEADHHEHRLAFRDEPHVRVPRLPGTSNHRPHHETQWRIRNLSHKRTVCDTTGCRQPSIRVMLVQGNESLLEPCTLREIVLVSAGIQLRSCQAY